MVPIGIANTPGVHGLGAGFSLRLILRQDQIMLKSSRKIFVIPFLPSSLIQFVVERPGNAARRIVTRQGRGRNAGGIRK
jgi:hypothetical protein